MCYIKNRENKCSLSGKSEGGDTITEKEIKFAQAYIKSGNATDAYVQIFGENNRRVAANKACRLKKSPQVKEYIDQRLIDTDTTNSDKVIKLLEAIAFTSPADFAKITTEGGKQKIVWQDIELLPEEVKKAIAVIKNTPSGIVIETLDRMKAIDLLIKHTEAKVEQGGGVIIEGSVE